MRYVLHAAVVLLFLLAGCSSTRDGAADTTAAQTASESSSTGGERERDSSPSTTRANEAEFKKPTNVILITIDTLRADVLESYGGPARSNHLSALARHGWQFDACTSASMLTNPSHASIMTSLYLRDHGVYDNESGISPEVKTLAETLSRRGLQTAALIGFPHLNPNVSNLGKGFERVIKASRSERQALETSKRALSLIDELEGDSPFFLWVHYVDPHAPYDPPKEHLPRAWPGKPDRAMHHARNVSPGFQRKNPWFAKEFSQAKRTSELVSRYVAEVEATDQAIGFFRAGLKRRGLDGSTALVITSDHGENLGEQDLFFHHGGLYPQTTHVPLLVSVPGMKPARIPELVATVDIAPTILELLNAPRWEPMRGQDLTPVALGMHPGRQFVFSEHMNAQLVSVQSQERLMIVHRKSTGQFPSYRFVAGNSELFERSNEGWQAVNENEPAFSLELKQALDGYLGAGLRLSARPAMDQDRESLRALGYIE